MFKILIVEDEKNMRQLISAILKTNGFETFTASNGEFALSVMEEQQIDLLILDIMMPEMDGYELTQVLRESKNGIPILMVSARQDVQDRRKGFRIGIDDYMTKPFDEEELVLRIRALLRRAQIAIDKRISIGQTILDYDSLTLSCKGETLMLPQKEFQLLFKLLSYPGVIFTKMQLMDEIWGMDSSTDDHTVNVHINRLRDKIKNNSDFEIITVRNVGYKIEKNERIYKK
ncbi:MAG: response regulator transcription factor [Lactovum sp.]